MGTFPCWSLSRYFLVSCSRCRTRVPSCCHYFPLISGGSCLAYFFQTGLFWSEIEVNCIRYPPGTKVAPHLGQVYASFAERPRNPEATVFSRGPEAHAGHFWYHSLCLTGETDGLLAVEMGASRFPQLLQKFPVTFFPHFGHFINTQ